jgi:FkbM family methyltransferase
MAARLPRIADRFLARLPRKLWGAIFECDLRDDISRQACFCGVYAAGETDLVRSLLPTGGAFVDVGANWGYFTLIAASRVGRNGQVLALEPDPRLLPVLLANIRHNGLSQVTALGVAAADRECEVELVGFDLNAGNFGLTRIAGPQETGQVPRFCVPGDTLDRILRRQRVESVDLLKMDIEGAESLR